ncbi:MAG: nitronate monooxygenase [Saprospiraceae bacterium]|nr:nitronate monooxygenase [Candidatus Vicinibacter affinis]MBP6173456.1 nitronate monooxygenase [Saprospiraceae bacterium]MBK6570930.1 nitronate monooxygenase [Candidatus Vicinibacter affinis]MBK7303309.1 nitronate monooxygenase [Candidatus Vicinibacter affinis]MBK7694931.1 nitronate monooxygenase [Candidatus Vicinibacter affinis]
METRLTMMLGIQFPVIMAPMFLVSNVAMVKSAIEGGITGVIPALNFRNDQDFRLALDELKSTNKPYGINLIVNRSNYKLPQQLKTCLEYQVPFIITSLGSPSSVIAACRPLGIKVFCDVSDMEYAHKAAALRPDALIAVNNQAGGHCGILKPEDFIPQLTKAFPDIPIISAGGVGNAEGIKKMLSLGACGVSVGTPFIASVESPVSVEYKNACVEYSSKDIVKTTKLSGVPCTVINTPYVQKIGTRQNWLERILSQNKTLKKWFKILVYRQGMNKLSKAAFSASYQNVWCAGPTIDFIHDILPVKEIIHRMVKGL